MKGLRRLFAESQRFYLCVFMLVMVFSLLDCWYICSDHSIVSIDEGSIERVQRVLETEEPNVAFQQVSVCLASAFSYRLEDIYICGVILVGILLILAAKQFAFLDERTREFRNTWPIKSWVRELYDYLSVLVMIVLGFLFQMVTLLVMQNRYNNMLIDLVGVDKSDAVVAEVLASSNESLVVTILYYIFSIALLYTWIYFGMSIAKNPIIGVIGALLIQYFTVYVCDSIVWRATQEYAYAYVYDGVEVSKLWLDFYNVLMTIICVISNSEASYYYDPQGGFRSTYYSDVGLTFCSVSTWVTIKIVLFVILVCGILWAAKKRDLSQGKLLYFPILDYPVAIFAGVAGTTIATDLFVSYNTLGYLSYNFFASVLVGVVVMVVTFWLMHPRSRKKSQCLEVK